MVETANTVWRNFVTDGVPSSGRHEPLKAKIRDWGNYLESLTQAAGYGNTVWFSTKALLDADLDHDAGTPSVVYADTTAANNGIYIKSGASGAGSWDQILTYLPGYQFVKATDAGAGTANAIVATSSPRVAYTDGVQLIRLNMSTTNTSADVTVAFDGGAALSIKTASNNNPAVGGLAAGMTVLGVLDEAASVFRLLSDQASSAIQTAAETAQTAAANSASAAATSEADAAASAIAANTSAGNATTSESNAADSEASAAVSAGAAATSETNAASSAATAIAAADNAGTSETVAAASAGNAALSEAASATSATAAALSETNAAASAAAAASAVPPAASQAEAEAGAETDERLFSPVRVKQAIAALASSGGGGGGIVWQPSDNTGASDMAAEINALVAALPAELANVTLAAGTYLINSDIVFTGFDQGTRLDFSGCKFTGSGRLIFDSCKHFNVVGADGRATDLVLRSIWFSTFTRCMFSDIIMLDQVGSSFTSVAWVKFLGGMYQRIHKPYPGSGTGYTNEINFYDVAFRGSATQEFTGTKDYALLLEGDTNCQSWKFFGGDFSEYNTGIISRGGSNTSDIEFIFDGIYFDNQAPPVGDSLDTIIVVRNCHTAGTYDIDHHIGYASRGNYELRNVTHGKAWLAGSVRNLIPNGDLDPTGNYSSTDSPPGPFSLTGVTQTTGTGVGYHDNYAGLEKNGTLYVPVPYFPFDTAATFQMVARSRSGFGTQNMRMGFGNPTRYRNFTLTESEWSFVTMSPDGTFTAGSSANITIFLNGGGAWGIDIAYIGVFAGVAAPMLP